MREIQWFIKMLEEEFGVKVDSSQCSFEALELYHEEIDETLVSLEMLENLPDPLLFEILLVELGGTEWLGLIGKDVKTRVSYLKIIINDGKTVFRERVK